MITTLWNLPVPSNALLDGGPVLEKRPRRELALCMGYEVDDGQKKIALVLEGVEAFKVTYYRARSDSMLTAHDRLVDLGRTTWLDEVTSNLAHHGADTYGLTHVMVNFDDGPCYEVICRSHHIEGDDG